VYGGKVRTLPADVQDVFGKALMAAQYGDQEPSSANRAFLLYQGHPDPVLA
jgi:hypothetical protein